jgi:hypothetical protein
VQEEGEFGLVRLNVSSYASKTTYNFEVYLRVTSRIKKSFSQGAVVHFFGQPSSMNGGQLVIDCNRLPQFVKVASDLTLLPVLPKSRLEAES